MRRPSKMVVPPFSPPPPQGILPLVNLSKLSARTLLPSLQAVESYVRSTLTADRTVPSPLAYSPDFDAYLERCLELAEAQTQGAAPYVLLLRIISHLRLGSDPKLVASFNNYYQASASSRGGGSAKSGGPRAGLLWGRSGRACHCLLGGSKCEPRGLGGAPRAHPFFSLFPRCSPTPTSPPPSLLPSTCCGPLLTSLPPSPLPPVPPAAALCGGL